MTNVVAVVLLALGTWVMRGASVAWGGSDSVPVRVRAALQHVSSAVLASFIALDIAHVVRHDDAPTAAILLGGLVVVAITTRLTRSTGLAVTIALALALLVELR